MYVAKMVILSEVDLVGVLPSTIDLHSLLQRHNDLFLVHIRPFHYLQSNLPLPNFNNLKLVGTHLNHHILPQFYLIDNLDEGSRSTAYIPQIERPINVLNFSVVS